MPYQLVSATNGTPISLKVGTFGSCSARLSPDTAKARTLPDVMLPRWPPSVTIHTEMRPLMMSITPWLSEL